MANKGCNIKWLSGDAISIEGIIDEYADFSSLSRRAEQTLNVDLSGVVRMNSSGIRSWIQSIMRYKVQLVLHNCSPIVVEQFSMIPEFIGRSGSVESFYGQFICSHCSHEGAELFHVGTDVFPGKSYTEQDLERECPSCGEIMELDHNPEIYFSFLRAMKPKLPFQAS